MAAALTAVVLALPAAAGAAPPPVAPMEITDVDVSADPVITAEVALPPGSANGSLPSSAFELDIDGIAATAIAERMPASSLEVVLVIDSSGSMKEGNAMGAAKDAAQRFLETLPLEASVGVVSFADTVSLISPLTTDRVLLSAAIDGLVARGETALHDALAFAPSLFSNATDDRQLLLLSDGGDTVSVASLDAGIQAVSGIRTSVIELVSSEANQDALRQVADSTGGTLTSIDDPSALEGLFEGVAARLAQRYRLQFDRSTIDGLEPGGDVVLAVRATSEAGVYEASQTITIPAVTSAPVTTSADATTPPLTVAAPAVPATDGDPVTTDSTFDPQATSTWGDAGVRTGLLALGGAAVFMAVFLLAFVAMPLTASERTANERTLLLPPPSGQPVASTRAQSANVTERLTGAADRMLERQNRKKGLAAALEVAGIDLRPGEFVVLVGAAAVVLGLVLTSLAGPLLGLLGVIIVPLIARVLVSSKAEARRQAFGDQLPDVLQLMISGLRAGYALPQALDGAANQSAEPARTELQRVLLEVRVGRDPADALDAAADRMRSRDFRWVVSAIQINREIGGELAGVLEKVAETIRERQRLTRQINTLTAEGRLSAGVLTFLPIALAALMTLTNRDYLKPLATSPGPIFVLVAILLLIVGWAWMRRLVRTQM